MMLRTKQAFFGKLNAADTKTFWRVLNHQQTSLPTLNHNGASIHSNESKADALNHYFYSCFNQCFPVLTI